jgi:hypothetical protein
MVQVMSRDFAVSSSGCMVEWPKYYSVSKEMYPVKGNLKGMYTNFVA